MRVITPGEPHLTYCTNIHPGETYADVRDHIDRYVGRVGREVAGRGLFGVGLRLSAAAAEPLANPDERRRFREQLERAGLYVFTLNGFPYGIFHRERVKEAVYQPDWLDERRLAYSDRLAEILADLLPDGVSGSVSTVPGAFKPRVAGEADAERMVTLIVRHAATLYRLEQRTGKRIELCLEPEPCCYIETTDETVRFFERIFSSRAAHDLARQTGLGAGESEVFLRRHVGVCFDACHLAVQYEEPRQATAALQAAGIRIGKVQLSAGLEVQLRGSIKDAPVLDALRGYAEDVYLHQVVERATGEMRRYVDLPEALRAAKSGALRGARDWRIHFHVPIFLERLGVFGSTQPFLADLLSLIAHEPITEHLEVETYTWDVLPKEHRRASVVDAIVRELRWVQERLAR
jgi:sugar phosphate isomerase/epimerase